MKTLLDNKNRRKEHKETCLTPANGISFGNRRLRRKNQRQRSLRPRTTKEGELLLDSKEICMSLLCFTFLLYLTSTIHFTSVEIPDG